MTQEERIEKNKRTVENSNNNQAITANVAQNTGNSGIGNFNSNSSNNRENYISYGRGYGGRNGRRRFFGRNNTWPPKPQCQVC